ncbi:MAG: DUF1992 domain-containing protein [Deltaproteobacteria bacterium]|nr:MAG: DUF1992 domain-containing protein [Deltaproteobacteria bacterium]
MDIIWKIADEKIREAMERGEFDNLPGKGKPVEIEDLSLVPPDLRPAYKLLKNAGYLPPEMELRKEIATLEAMLEEIDDERVLEETVAILNEKILSLNIMEKRSLPLERKQYYADALRRKLRLKKVRAAKEGK